MIIGIKEFGSNLKFYDISELLLMALGLNTEKLKKNTEEVV